MRDISSATKDYPAIVVNDTVSAEISGNIVVDYPGGTLYGGVLAEIGHNLCWNNNAPCPAGNGNLNTDPQFVDLVDYRLSPTSPAIDAGPPDYPFGDLDRTRNDMGVYGGPWSIGQYDAQRDPNNFAPYVYPLFKDEAGLSGGSIDVQALGVARLR